MSKIIAREIPPNEVDFSFYFDSDVFKSISGRNCAIFIINHDGCCVFNSDEYDYYIEMADSYIYAVDTIDEAQKWFSYYKMDFSIAKWEAINKWVESSDTNLIEEIVKFISIIEDVEYSEYTETGYAQGERCSVIFCKEKYTEEEIIEIGKLWLGCGVEFCIDGNYGFYMVDNVRFDEDNIIQNVAELYGCKPTELEVQLYTGSHVVSDYKTIEYKG